MSTENTAEIYVLDTETTGLKKPEPPASGIVQYAWIKVDAQMNMLGERMEYCSPGCPIEEGAMAVHGITEEMVAGKPKFDESFKLEAPMYFVAHNAKFDYPRMASQIDNCVGVLCTMEGAKRFLKGQPNNKLGTLVEHFGLEKFDAHDALGDVKMALQVLKLIMQVSGMSFFDLQEALRNPKIPDVMPFGKHRGAALKDVPMGYIEFMLGLKDLDMGLRKGLEMQKRMRGAI